MFQSSTNFGSLSILPLELRSMIYENLIPTKLQVNILSPAYDASTQALVSPLDSLAGTSKTLNTEIKAWYAHTQKAKSIYPELTRNLSLGLGIHNPSTVTFFVNFSEFLGPANPSGAIDSGKLAEVAQRLQEFSQTKTLPEIKALTVYPHLLPPQVQTGVDPDRANRFHHSIQFALFKHILFTTFPKIMDVAIHFNVAAPSTSRPAQLSFLTAIKSWNIARHYLDGRGEDFDEEIDIELFVDGEEHGIEEGELPFYREIEIGSGGGKVVVKTKEVEKEILLGWQCGSRSEGEERAMIDEWRVAEGMVEEAVAKWVEGC